MAKNLEFVLSDQYAFTNPGFGSVALHWLCKGYQKVTLALDDNAFRHLLLPWGTLALALLAPEGIRSELPASTKSKLSILFDRRPEWRAVSADAIRAWSRPAWEAIRLGVGKEILQFEAGRIVAIGQIHAPDDEYRTDVKKRATTLGRLFAMEGSDSRLGLAVGVELVK